MKRDYWPYGVEEVAAGDQVLNYRFSGKELDSGTGLYYFGARYYDAELGRWLAPDPHSDKYSSLSPYAYCGNNPIVFIDPTGMDSIQAQQLNEILESTHDDYKNQNLVCNEATVKALKEYLKKQGVNLPEGIFYDNNGELLSADQIIDKLFESITPDQMASYVKEYEGHVIIAGRSGKSMGGAHGHLDLVGMEGNIPMSGTYKYLNPLAIGTSKKALSLDWSVSGRISYSFGKNLPNYFLYTGFTPRPNNAVAVQNQGESRVMRILLMWKPFGR